MMKLLFKSLGFAVLVCGTLWMQGQSSTAPIPKIEVSTVKPSDPSTPGETFAFRGRHFVTTNTDVSDLIRFAYGLNSTQLQGGPAWLTKDKFDLDVLPDLDGIPSDAQMRGMTRELLEDRFQLRFHREKKELPVYALTVAKGGPKLTSTKVEASDHTDFYGWRGHFVVRNGTMQAFAEGLARGWTDRPVDDQTGLTGRYDFTLQWTPDDASPTAPDAPPGFYTAFQEQLGLKLTPARGPVDVLVVDSIQRPSND
jgi:uncharacterized protein (TIGR03435 family)